MSRLVTRTAAILVCGWVFLPPSHTPDLPSALLAVVAGLGFEALGRWVANGGLL